MPYKEPISEDICREFAKKYDAEVAKKYEGAVAGIAGNVGHAVRDTVADTQSNLQFANDRQVGGSHYRQQDTTGCCPNCQADIQHWDFAGRMPYLEGQITKYVTRWRGKDGLRDLHKAAHYLQKLIEIEEKKLTKEKGGILR